LSGKGAWPILIRSSAVVSLVAGLIFLVQLAWVGLAKLTSSVPFWLLLTASASCFVCGWFFGIWIQSRRLRQKSGGKLRKLGQIRFDYLPSPPTKNDWRIGLIKKIPPEQRTLPEFAAAQPAPLPGSLTIRHNEHYSIDYTVGQVQSLANIVEYYVKPTSDGTFYLKVNVSSRDGSHARTVWLRHVIGTGAPRQINPSEWSFDVQGELLKDGWTLVKLSVEDEVTESFGKEGFVYQGLQDVRIRGNLSISPITFYRIES